MEDGLRMDDMPLPDASRVRKLVAVCEWVEAQPAPSACFAQAAAEASARMASLEGPASRPLSAGTMRRLYYAWKKAGRDWRALVDRRTAVANAARVRTAQPAFRAYLAGLAAKHRRALAGAVRELYKAWAEGRAIPGYEGMNYKPGMPIPAGWSMDNIKRLMPDKRALKMTREGVRAASAMLPQVFSTRAGGWPLSRVMFDDVWLDCLAQGYGADGRLNLDRPLQLGALDYYTGKRLSWFTKLRTKGEDGKSLQLNEREMVYLLCDFLANVGYSKRGTVLVCEHGTAAISREVEEALAMLSGGCITVDRSGLTGTVQPGAFGGRAVGNPRAKAALESWHNALHNAMDGVLTQVGKDRKEPEALWGIRKAAEDMARRGEKMDEAASLALAPYAPTLAELGELLVQVVGGLNNRTDHNLEGWSECGFTTLEFSMTGKDCWTRIEDMPETMAAMATAMGQEHPELLRSRKLSPQEAWEKACVPADIVRFTPAQCLAVMGTACKFKLAAKGGAFQISSTKRHHRQLLFETVVQTADGYARELPAGRDYWGILNPLSEALYVLDEKERVLGMAQPLQRFSHVDEAAKLREFGRVVHRRAEELARVSNLVAPQTAELAARREYNRDVLAGGADPLAAQDRRTERRLKNSSARVEESPALMACPAVDGTGLDEDYGNESYPFN